MTELIAALLVIVAALLFYRFVERRDKILLGKLLGGILALIIAFVGLWWWRDKRRRERAAAEDSRRDSALTVAFLPESSGTDSIAVRKHLPDRNRIGFRVCNVSGDTVDTFTVYAFTWNKGHSQRLPVWMEEASPSYSVPNSNPMERIRQLTSDLVLSPKRCGIVVFQGNFAGNFDIRDSVDASATATFRRR